MLPYPYADLQTLLKYIAKEQNVSVYSISQIDESKSNYYLEFLFMWW